MTPKKWQATFWVATPSLGNTNECTCHHMTMIS